MRKASEVSAGGDGEVPPLFPAEVILGSEQEPHRLLQGSHIILVLSICKEILLFEDKGETAD